jgi:hypothetical protein
MEYCKASAAALPTLIDENSADVSEPVSTQSPPDEDRDALFLVHSHISKVAGTARKLRALRGLLSAPDECSGHFRTWSFTHSETPFAAEDDRLPNARQVFALKRALNAPVEERRKWFSSICRVLPST